MPALHKRWETTEPARVEFSDLFHDWISRHDLSYLEAIRILNEKQGRLAALALRVERHGPNSDKKADER